MVRITVALTLSLLPIACSRLPEAPAQRDRRAELAEKIVGTWSNADKCLVIRMEFRANGSVSYDVGLPQMLEGVWKITEDARLELTPDPVVVSPPEPNPTGIMDVEITETDFTFNGDGPATANKPIGGLFRRVRQ